MSAKNTAKATTKTNESAVNENSAIKTNNKAAPGQGKPRVLNNPNDIATLVLMQVDNVNVKKDELTSSLKGLTDLTKQLARAYGEHTRVINELQKRVKELEGKKGS